METSELTADVLVIGFGKGGKTAAQVLADHGQRVVLVEQSEQMYGGTCPNVGCVPSKMMVHYSNAKRPEDDADKAFAHAIAGLRDLTATFRASNYESLNGMEMARVITGAARFVDAHTVAVDAGEDQVSVSAETILVNAGSEPIIPAVPGLETSSHLVSSTDLLQRDRLPRHLVVIGGGYLGLEFAGIYRGFGSEVTVLESLDRVLPREDEDIGQAVSDILAGDGIELVTGAEVLEVVDNETTSSIVYTTGGRTETAEADAVLPATGRKPVTEHLNLAAAGVEVSEHGAIKVDEHLRTSQSHIFALGDVNGGPQFTYVSLDDSRVVLDQLLGDGKRTITDRVAVPHTLFITPPLATVGLTEHEARAAGIEVKVSREKVADIVAMPRAYTVEETRGVMKFIVDATSDLVVGAALLTIDAQEIINVVALAMRHDITATELRDSIYTHPSSTEALNEVFDQVVS